MKNIKIIIIIIVITFILSPAAYAATLSLSPSSGTFNRGCVSLIAVVLDAAGTQTDGSDAILKYDPSRINATSITSGTIYPDYPGNNIDSSSGKITISGLASVQQAFSGKGTLATINFSVPENAPTGATSVKFEFDPNDKAKTTDSNVVERGTIVDVLNSVVDGNYTIGTGACGTTVTTPKGGASVSTPSAEVKKTLPPAGTETFTYAVAILGSIFTILGFLGLVLL